MLKTSNLSIVTQNLFWQSNYDNKQTIYLSIKRAILILILRLTNLERGAKLSSVKNTHFFIDWFYVV